MGLHQAKRFCTVKETITKMKRPPTEQEKIFVNDMSDRALLPETYKQLIQVNMFLANLILKWAED